MILAKIVANCSIDAVIAQTQTGLHVNMFGVGIVLVIVAIAFSAAAITIGLLWED